LQKMIDAGELTDDAGNKITDLKGIGVDFSNSMSKGLEKIDADLKILLAGLGLIPKILDSIPTDVNINVGWNVAPPPDIPQWWDASAVQIAGASRGGLVTASGIQSFAGGGRVLPFTPRGTDTVPAMLTPGEMVLTRDQQRAVGGGGVDLVSAMDRQTMEI